MMGSSFDWSALQFLGADKLVVGTIAIKDNTLFAGNIASRDDSNMEGIQEILIKTPLVFKAFTTSREISKPDDIGFTFDEPIMHWRLGENYRLGLQGQYANGQWASPLWVGKDVLVDLSYEPAGGAIYYTKLVLDKDRNVVVEGQQMKMSEYYDKIMKQLLALDIRKVRPVYVELTFNNRRVISQGVLTGSIANYGSRTNGGTYAMADWLCRMNKEFLFGTKTESRTYIRKDDDGDYAYNLTPMTTIPYLPLGFSYFLGDDYHVENAFIPNTLPWLQHVMTNWDKYDTSDLVALGSLNALQSYLIPDNAGNDEPLNTRGMYSEVYCRTAPPLKLGDDKHVMICPVGEILGITSDNHDKDAVANNDKKFSTESLAGSFFFDPSVMGFYSPETVYESFGRSLPRQATRVRFRGIANIGSTGYYVKHSMSNGRAFDFNNVEGSPDEMIASLVTSYDNYFWKHDDYHQQLTWGQFGPKEVKASGSELIDFVYRTQSLFSISKFSTMIKESVNLNDEISSPEYCLPDDDMVMIDNLGKGMIQYVPNPREVVRDPGKGYSWEINFTTPGHIVFTFSGRYAGDCPVGYPVMGISNYVVAYSGERVDLTETVKLRTNLSSSYFEGIEVSPIDAGYLYCDPSRNPGYDGNVGGSAMLNFGKKWFDGKNNTCKSGLPYAWVCDLTREVTNQYGANDSLASLRELRWIPAGEAVSIAPGTFVEYTRGDTYIQRFSFLKSQPRDVRNSEQWSRFSHGVSLWIESFVNLDGRYDKWKRSYDLRPYTYETWGKVNEAYTQSDNFFQYQIVDHDLARTVEMPTTFTWSKAKVLGELIDSYASLRLVANTYTTDGAFGPINKIVNSNNTLVGFQDSGIFQILFNARVQVPISDGVPVEIAQSYKVEGTRYLTTSSGTTNKWSVGLSRSGIYYMDDLNRDICFIGNEMTDLSTRAGMKSWCNEKMIYRGPCSLGEGKERFSCSIDKIHDHVYFTNHLDSLCYNEAGGYFEGFYSHEGHPFMFNYLNDFYSVDVHEDEDETREILLWRHHDGKGCEFYGEYRESWITFILNPSPLADKIWDNFQFRGHRLDDEGKEIRDKTISYVEVWNDYQHNFVSHDVLSGKGLNLLPQMGYLGQHKYQRWTFPFPRDFGSLNRLRSPWLYLRLVYDNEEGASDMNMHDLTIVYTL
jgi:hypothetical protein